MKISVSKDFGNNRKPVLSLVPDNTLLDELTLVVEVSMVLSAIVLDGFHQCYSVSFPEEKGFERVPNC